jgi:two-component system chemotaxis response regulator CheB
MERTPTPIVVISAVAAEGEPAHFQALELGAVEVCSKPNAQDPVLFERQAEQLRLAVRAVAGVRLITRIPRSRPRAESGAQPVDPAIRGTGPAVLALAASTGGPPALARILSALPPDFPLPVVVVQHIAEGFEAGLVRWLATHSRLRIKLAEHGERLSPGTVLLAPGNRHLMLSLGRVRLDDGPALRGSKPSATVLFASLAREYGGRAAGVVLTGMGEDGAAGLKLVRQQGGRTFAQGEISCVVNGMPRAAIQAGAVEQVLELDELAQVLGRLGARPEPASRGSRKRLLLVDDTETILELERLALADHYDLLVARNGQQALELAQREIPDGILMDYAMPVMNGGEALRALRARPSTREIPVIMVTSEQEPHILASCWQGGCRHIVAKPFERSALLVAVQRHVPA